jgi:hypothetical protein
MKLSLRSANGKHVRTYRYPSAQQPIVRQPARSWSLSGSLDFLRRGLSHCESRCIGNLLSTEPPEVVLELLEQSFLKLAYETNQLLIMTENDNTAAALHQPTAGHMDAWNLPVVLRTVLHKVYGRSGKARRVANRLEKKIELVRYSENFTNEAAEDLSDEQYVEESVRTLLRTYVPEYRDPVQFPNETTWE